MTTFMIRNAQPADFEMAGNVLVEVYSQLDEFPKPDEQPAYYAMLQRVGDLTQKPGTEIILAVNPTNEILGVVVYFDDMQYYGSGGTATREKNAAGFRLLGVRQNGRGLGIGKSLSLACIEKAKAHKRDQLIIHTTNAMQTAWRMYEQLGFVRSTDLDFMQGSLQVFGFRYRLS